MKRSPFSLLRAGFTLLEIMLVVLIIGLLIGLAIKNQALFLGEGQRTAVMGHIEQLKTTLLMYQAQNGFYPSTEQGLKALTVKPESEPKPRSWRQYMEKPMLDPWKQEYFYEYPGKHNPNSYDIYSAGADRKPGTPDDIGNWETASN